MAATADPLQRGFPAPDFHLPGVDGRSHTLAELRGPKGLLVMFICNHCPYVQAVADRMVQTTSGLAVLVDPACGPVTGLVTLHDLWRAQVRVTE